ncbi:ATP-dependent Clp protease ATP-binding subunit ClpX [Bifidobacterium apri]|uniref:ATP-dependent Clp protease ATP-binding subunit ClpX n=1 Tax=Bifidobacterium apri TaxID=1769423 RepID=UPI003992046B
MSRVISYQDDIRQCTFCGKTERQVRKLVAGPGVAICDECIALCVEMIGDEERRDAERNALDVPKPAQIMQYLDSHVIGQPEAKRTLAVAVYNHYKRVNMELQEAAAGAERRQLELLRNAGEARGASDRFADVRVAKSNILMLGPTGVGKTYLAQTLAEVMHVPFVIADATTLTEAGYVGDDVETVLQRLIQEADGDLERARHGIIYIDEIDKIARKSGENTSITRDVSGEGVQQALLKILEGTVATVPLEGTRKHREQESVQIDTRDILFICGGAFVGLTDIVAQRVGAHESGFGAAWHDHQLTQDELLAQANADDLEAFGLLPEFIGRLPVVTTLHALGRNDLERILTEPANALVKQYQKLFLVDGVDLEFTPAAIAAIAKTAITQGTGARGLRSIIEHALEGTMYELPQMQGVARVVVDADAIVGTGRPVLLAAGERLEDAPAFRGRSAAGGASTGGAGDDAGDGTGGAHVADDADGVDGFDADAAPTADIAIIHPENDGRRSGSRRA